jgi:hypothetical protein
VAVLVRDRPWPAVLSDMVEGVVAANRLKGTAADELRAGLWRAVSKAQTAETVPAKVRHLRPVPHAA